MRGKRYVRLRILSRSSLRAHVVALVVGAVLLAGGTGCDLPAFGAQPQPSPTTAPQVVYQNPLTALASGWSNDGSGCFFGPDGYHVAANFACYAPAGSLTDVDVTVQVKQISGPLVNPYGIIVRHTDSASYEFDVMGTGEWQLTRCFSGTCSYLAAPTQNAAIASGLNSIHTLEIRAAQTHFDLFVDGIQVGKADDTLVVSGTIGLAVSKDMECVFTNVVITKLG